MATGRMHKGTGVSIKNSKGALETLAKGLAVLIDSQVLVGFPEGEKNKRKNGPEGPDTDLVNAQIAYIQDQGEPALRIPARSFMEPGIEEVNQELGTILGKTAMAVLRGGGEEKANQGLTQAGFKAANSIKRKINEGIPPPLSETTLRQRLRKGRRDGAGARKGAMIELDRRADGQAPSMEYAKPLVDTAQMRNAVTFVIRSRKKKEEQ